MPQSPRLLCRELSLLAFNRRVLAQAQDVRVPLLERLRFCASCHRTSTSFRGAHGLAAREHKRNPPASSTAA